MKKITAIFLSFITILLISGCSQNQKQTGGIATGNGYFNISAEDFLTELNQKIKAGNNSEYPQLPTYSGKQNFGNLTEYVSAFDDGAALRVDENQSKKVVCITFLLDVAKATKQGADYSGYYLSKAGMVINPNSDNFKSLTFKNLAVNNIQSTQNGNIFCVVVNENGIQQCRMYPLSNG